MHGIGTNGEGRPGWQLAKPGLPEKWPLKQCVCICLFSDPSRNIAPMDVSKLSVFETVSEVTGYVQVQLNDSSFTSLRFLRNLRRIHGRRTAR